MSGRKPTNEEAIAAAWKVVAAAQKAYKKARAAAWKAGAEARAEARAVCEKEKEVKDA